MYTGQIEWKPWTKYLVNKIGQLNIQHFVLIFTSQLNSVFVTKFLFWVWFFLYRKEQTNESNESNDLVKFIVM